MTDRRPYTYTTLRYVHDGMTGEFVNVGVVVVSKDGKYVGAKLRHTHARLSGVFPDLDRDAFRSAMRRLEAQIKKSGREIAKIALPFGDFDATTIVRQAMPSDDSSLQWSSPGGGVAHDLDAVLERLFGRLVARYDLHSERRRTDDDVWRPVREQLEANDIAKYFSEKTISGRDDEIEFKHAWKNGIWHCVQPLSFDLSDSDGIKDKARRWTGHLAAVSDTTEHFRPYFLVARPSQKKLEDAFETAISILRKSPQAPEIYLESERDALVHKMADEIELHLKTA